GNIYYVDSNVTSEGDGTSWTNARNTLDEAVGLCTADNGDIIYVAQGHTEDWTAVDSADLDQAGITVIGCGEGEHRPLFTLDGANAELVIGDASIMITNLRFMASVDSTVHIIEVEDDADGFIIYNCEFMEPESANTTDEADDIIQVAAGANQGFIVNNIFYSLSAGANTAIDLTAGVIEDITIAYNYFNGAWAEGAIFSDDIDLRCQIIGNTVIQLDAAMTPITFDTTATGIMEDNWCVSKSTTYLIDAGSMQCKGNMWSDTDTTDVAAVPMFTSETGVDIWAASQTAQIEAEATDALEADHLDHLAAVSVADEIVNQSFLADITSATQDWSTFVAADDSLEAISDKITALEGVNFMMTATGAGAATTFISTDGGDGFGDDYFNTGWSLIITYDAGAVGGAPEGDIRDIVDYVSTTGTFTVAPIWSGAQSTAIGDKAIVVRHEDLDEYASANFGGSGKILYVDASQPGTPDTADIGGIWDLGYTTIALAIAGATASNGDVILVAAGHTETIADAQLTWNVAGVRIIGMGVGSTMPIINFNHANASIDVTAADVYVEGIRFRTIADDVLVGIDIAGTGDGFHIKNCIFDAGTATDEFLETIEFKAAAAANVTIEGCEFYADDTADATEAIISEVGASDNTKIIGNTFIGSWVVAPVYFSQAHTNMLVKDNVIQNLQTGQHAFEATAACTGMLVDNVMHGDTITAI
ncbi:MAG: right-handed parallel beta-helix repeat-containing protein, partial [Planctomycetota bacterium]